MVKEQSDLISEEEQARLEKVRVFFDFVEESLKNADLNPGHKKLAKKDLQGARAAEFTNTVYALLMIKSTKQVNLSETEKIRLISIFYDYGIRLGLDREKIFNLLETQNI